MRVVIRSDPHEKMNEYVEKYSYLNTKRTAKNNACSGTSFSVRKLATSCGFLRGACA